MGKKLTKIGRLLYNDSGLDVYLEKNKNGFNYCENQISSHGDQNFLVDSIVNLTKTMKFRYELSNLWKKD